MEKPKYKAGDVVHVHLADCDAELLNEYGSTGIGASNIIAHIPAPEPVVRYLHVYDDRKTVMCGIPVGVADLWCVLRLEWPDGDTNKKPIVTVEDV